MPLPRNVMILTFFVAVAIVLGGAAALDEFGLPGLSSARPEPPQAEIAVATWLLHHSVPVADQQRRNPFGADPADIAAGHDLFQKNCEVCHGYDGNGKTQIGGQEYPRAPVLRSLLTAMTDGEVFYHIRNGIRNTGMPAWTFPDNQVWQLVLFMRNLPKVAPVSPVIIADHPGGSAGQYARIGNLQGFCHADIYERWKKTPMANVVQDPREHPDVIIPDFSKTDPFSPSTMDDMAFVYGSKWKQSYFTKVGDDYFLFRAQWDVTHKLWRQYIVGTAGLVDGALSARQLQAPHRPAVRWLPLGQLQHPDQTVSEWNVGCEQCHGAGQRPCRQSQAGNILNPSRQNYVQANDTCIQCHSQGQPLSNPIEGKYYDWPVAINAGLNWPISGSWKNTSWAKLPSPTLQTAPRIRTGCRATISSRA